MKGNKTNYLFNLISNYGATFSAIIAGFILPPLSLSYWKVEKYGIWALITSVVFYLGISSLGIETSASILMAKNPEFKHKIKILKRSAFMLLIAIMVSSLIFFLVNLYYKGWINLLGKIPPEMIQETYVSVLVFAAFYFINWPFALVSSAFSGFQKLYIDNLFRIFGSFINLIAMCLVIYFRGTLVTFALCIGLITLFLNIVKLLYFYIFVYRKGRETETKAMDIQPASLSPEDLRYRSIITTGIRLTVFGFASLVINSVDNFIISNLMSVGKVTPYSITFKLFSIMINIGTMFYGSLAPILGKEFGNHNWAWLNKTYRNFQFFAMLIGGMMWLGGVLFVKDFVLWWVGKDGYAGLPIVFIFGFFCYLSTMVNLNNFLIISFNYTKYFYLMGWMDALIHIGAAILLSKWFGLAGVAMGGILGSLCAQTWLSPLILAKSSGSMLKYDVGAIARHLFLVIIPLIALGLALQLQVNLVLLRLGGGLVILSAYIFLSYLFIPRELKEYIFAQFKAIRSKFL